MMHTTNTKEQSPPDRLCKVEDQSNPHQAIIERAYVDFERFLQDKDYKKAIALAREMFSKRIYDAKMQSYIYYEIIKHHKNGDFESVRDLLKEALKILPQNARLLVCDIQQSLHFSNYEQVLKSTQKLKYTVGASKENISITKIQKAIGCEIGKLLAKGNYEKATYLSGEAMTIFPDNIYFVGQYISSAISYGAFENALELIKKEKARGANIERYENMIGHGLVRLFNEVYTSSDNALLDYALKIKQEALEIFPNSQNLLAINERESDKLSQLITTDLEAYFAENSNLHVQIFKKIRSGNFDFKEIKAMVEAGKPSIEGSTLLAFAAWIKVLSGEKTAILKNIDKSALPKGVYDLLKHGKNTTSNMLNLMGKIDGFINGNGQMQGHTTKIVQAKDII